MVVIIIFPTLVIIMTTATAAGTPAMTATIITTVTAMGMGTVMETVAGGIVAGTDARNWMVRAGGRS